MRRIYNIALFALSMALLSACDRNIYESIEFGVSLDSSNTYIAGDPVTFNFEGNADYIIIFTGETGSEYQYRDRTSVAMEDLEKCTLELRIQARYGVAGALKYYVANGFEGLIGTDAEQDYNNLTSIVNSGYSGWDALNYAEGASTVWTTHEYDITQYAENFTLAIHWNPPQFNQTQRTYWIIPTLKVKFKGYDEATVSASDMGFTALSMNDANATNRYIINNGNGSVVLNKPETADIIMQGVGANVLSYSLDSWVISKPRQLNSISSDKGLNIKSLSDDVYNYTYTYEQPGEYTVSFVATSANIDGLSRVVKEVSFVIVDRL